jgi:hypothetical protein
VHVAFVELNLKGDLQEEDGGRRGHWPRRGARVGRVILTELLPRPRGGRVEDESLKFLIKANFEILDVLGIILQKQEWTAGTASKYGRRKYIIYVSFIYDDELTVCLASLSLSQP